MSKKQNRSAVPGVLPAKLKPVEQQRQFLKSERRFNVAPAGRRAGKTMTGKLRGRKRALEITHEGGRVVFAAPTHRQAKRVFWRDVKKMFKGFTIGRPSESDLQLTLVTGTVVEVAGLDVPERIEGPPLDHIHLDEYANMKPSVWTEHIRPMLAETDRPLGTADFTGTPEGRNHYYELFLTAQEDEEWGAFTWTSEEVLDEKEVERLKIDLDELTYNQEVRASFVNFEGRAYYAFDRSKHVAKLDYSPHWPLCLCMDFNAKPGTCSTVQEVNGVVQVIHEVYINRYSNTPEVVRKWLDKFRKHSAELYLYGDPAGNQNKSSNVMGTDWDLVVSELRPHFGDRIVIRVPDAPPSVRDSVNAVNAKLSSGELLVNRSCSQMIRGLDGVERDEAGALVKPKHDMISHLPDGLRYYIAEEHPVDVAFGSHSTHTVF